MNKSSINWSCKGKGFNCNTCKDRHKCAQSTYESPIGLTPKNVWESARKQEIIQAINRFSIKNEKIPQEWIDELNDLISRNVL